MEISQATIVSNVLPGRTRILHQYYAKNVRQGRGRRLAQDHARRVLQVPMKTPM
jgi:hypothetical protein